MGGKDKCLTRTVKNQQTVMSSKAPGGGVRTGKRHAWETTRAGCSGPGMHQDIDQIFHLSRSKATAELLKSEKKEWNRINERKI